MPHDALVQTSDTSFGGFIDVMRPKNKQEAVWFCEQLAQSDLVPPSFRGKWFNVLICVQMGERLGYDPFQSLQNIAVVNGKPTIYGDEPLARVQRSARYEWHREDDLDTIAKTGQATCTVKRRGSEPVSVTFTIEMAKKARLWGKAGPWTQYPERMLQLRARAFALRNQFADALGGISIREELDPIKDIHTGEPAERPKPENVVSPPQLGGSTQDEGLGLSDILRRFQSAQDTATLDAVAQDAKRLNDDEAVQARKVFVERRKEIAGQGLSKAQQVLQRRQAGSASVPPQEGGHASAASEPQDWEDARKQEGELPPEDRALFAE